MTGRSTPVLLAPLLDPGQGRVSFEVPPGTTIAEIVSAALPGLSRVEFGGVRVVIVSETDARPVAPHLWPRVRPKPGARVILRLVPGNENARSILLSVVAIAAFAVAPAVAGALGITSQLGVGLVGLGLNVAASYLVNTLIPIEPPDPAERRETFQLRGWRNEARPDAPLPFVLGRHRYAPPFAAMSYSEFVGDTQYVRAIFGFGYGRLKIEDMRLGQTPISEFDEVQMEVREGLPGDDPVTLYPRQVLEESVGVDLVRPYPRNDAGEIVDGDPIETPVVRMTARDTQTVSAIIAFPEGLWRADDEGGAKARSAEIRIRQRLSDADPWSDVETLTFRSEKREPFFRQHTWQLPSRGRWQIEFTRMTPEETKSGRYSRTNLTAIQSIRPEYPIAFDKPLALVALRVKATYQLNGQLDDFNALVTRYCDDWNGGTWSVGLPRNPAAAYLAALRGPANAFPVADSEIDWDVLQDWHVFCSEKGLKYDRVHDSDQSFGDILRSICQAGRAMPRHDGIRWGVVIDRPSELVVDHINGRNSRDFSWSRSYSDLPDAFRVQFFDETNEYEEAQRIIPRPGHTGSIDIVEDLGISAKTDPAEVYVEAMRRWYEILHRPDTYSVMQDGAARVATRGDDVMASFDVLDRTQVAARVTRSTGTVVELDEVVTFEAGTTYGLRFRVYADDDDSIGVSRVVEIAAAAGSTRVVRLKGASEMPGPGDLVHFGPLATESFALKVLGVEAGADFSQRLTLVSAAPIIDELTDAIVPPPWSGRVGSVIVQGALVPPAPRFVSVTTTAEVPSYLPNNGPDDRASEITVLLSPGAGSGALLTSFRIEHRLLGAGTWDLVTFPVAEGGASFDGYERGDQVEIRAVAIAADATESAFTPVITVPAGSGSADLPASLDDSAIVVTGDLGVVRIVISTPSSSDISSLALFRVPQGVTLDPEQHQLRLGLAIAPGEPVFYYDGDPTRETVADGLDAAASWTAGGGWAISGGSATHTPGAASVLSQGVTLTAGQAYRIAFEVSGRTAGSVTPELGGGTAQSGAAVTGNGQSFAELTAVSGNTSLRFAASSTFDGTITGVTIYRATAAAAPQGAWDYYAAPQNAEGVLGALSGPYTTTIK